MNEAPLRGASPADPRLAVPTMTNSLPTFRYPRSGVLLAHVLEAMGHGGKNWPEKQVSAKTFQRIADDEPTPEKLTDFFDEAFGLLTSSSGRWHLENEVLTRTQVFERIVSALRDYDRGISTINASPLADASDRRHALAPLALVAARLGAIVGIYAAARDEPLADTWQRSPLDPSAFSRAVEHYAKAALPDGTWEERAEICGISNTTLGQWRRLSPGPKFKFISLETFAGEVAARIDGGDAARILWHLRWLAAGARLLAGLDAYLGRDADGRPWIDRLRETAEHHARINHFVCREMVGLDLLVAELSPAARASLDPEADLVLRRLCAWLIGRSKNFDAGTGQTLADDDMNRLHALLGDNQDVRRGVWLRLGLLHAFGMPTPGYLQGLARIDADLAPYTVFGKDPAGYLVLKHQMIDARLRDTDVTLRDDQISAVVGLVFTPERGAALLHHGWAKLAEAHADPKIGAALLHAAQRLDLYQRDLAGLPVPQVLPAPVIEGAPDDLREAIEAIEVQHALPKLLERGTDAIPEILELMTAHPTLPEPVFVLTIQYLEKLIANDQDCRFMSRQLAARLAEAASSPGPATYRVFRKILPLRRRARKLLASVHQSIDVCLAQLDHLADAVHDPWQVHLARHVFAGRRAAVARAFAVHDRDAWTTAVRDVVAALAALHAERPEHTEPLLWLTRFHTQLGERAEARRFAKLAAHLGERTALAELDRA